MIYQGTFKDRFEQEYTVKITTDGDASRVTTLTLGTPPFTTSMDSEGDTLYKTAKYQSATITYVSKMSTSTCMQQRRSKTRLNCSRMKN